ncbi:MAG TPA: hypothetical protein VHB48_19630 [Chitinophagaceae bacterium]|nr:hypothetical protein [Chitinophagaceae bacterium]
MTIAGLYKYFVQTLKKSNTTLCLVLIMAVLPLQALQAQVKTQLQLAARPTSLLATWANHPEILNYIIMFQGGAAGGSLTIKIKATFKDGTGNVIGTSDLNFLPNRVITAGTTVLQSRDVVLLQTIHFTGSALKALNTTGRMPAGSYQLSLQLLDAQTLAPVSEETTRPFTLLSYQLPVLMLPQNEAVLAAEQARVAITFRWTPLAPAPSQERISYMLQVFEIQPGQTPVQALRSNQPLLNKQVTGTTQYIWQPQLYMADSAANRKFIWTVQTLYEGGYGFNNGAGDGRSEPFWFEIKSAKEILDSRKQ